MTHDRTKFPPRVNLMALYNAKSRSLHAVLVELERLMEAP